MDMPQPRRPPIFGPPRVNRFQEKCKYCKKEQNRDVLQWHETQCEKKPKDPLDQIVNTGVKLLRGFSQGIQRMGNVISNELNQFQRNVFGDVQHPQQTYQEEFDRNYQEIVQARQQLPQQEPNLVEYDFKNQRNLSPSAKMCCICQEEYNVNERVVILQCMHRYHKICLNDWINKKPICPIYISKDTNADDQLADIKELEKEEGIQTSNQQDQVKKEEEQNINNSKETEVETESESSTDDEEQNENADNFFEILQALKPLFGLRFGDVERNDEGEIIDETNKKEEDIQDQPSILEDQIEQTIKQIEADPLMLQWDEVMNDFDPEDLLTFDLPSGSTEILSEVIQKPTTIRGAYFIPQFRRDQKIDFYIKSSNNTVLYSKERVQEGIFSLEIPEKGEYKFIFANKRTKETLPITFALDVHDSHQEFLKMADLDPLALRIERLQIAMRDNYFYDKMAGQQFEGGLKEVQNANNKLLIFSFIEIIGIVAITGWQVFYLKRIMSNQRII